MIPYILILVLLLGVSIIGVNPALKNRKYIYFATAIVLILFAALRNHVGYDWDSYNSIYENIRRGSDYKGAAFIEYGFQWLAYISPSFRFLIFITASISLSVSFIYLYKFTLSSLPLLALIVFASTLFLPTYMGQIRQGLAMSLVLCGYYEILNDRNRKAILLIILASFFHLSALMALGVCVFRKKRFNYYIYITAIALSIACSSLFLPFFAKLLTYADYGFAAKLLHYSASGEEELGITSVILIRIAILIISLYLLPSHDSKVALLINIYSYGIILYFILACMPQLAGRGTYYFSMVDSILLPLIIIRFYKNRNLYIVGYFTVILLSVYRLVKFFTLPSHIEAYTPYFR